MKETYFSVSLINVCATTPPPSPPNLFSFIPRPPGPTFETRKTLRAPERCTDWTPISFHVTHNGKNRWNVIQTRAHGWLSELLHHIPKFQFFSVIIITWFDMFHRSGVGMLLWKFPVKIYQRSPSLSSCGWPWSGKDLLNNGTEWVRQL